MGKQMARDKSRFHKDKSMRSIGRIRPPEAGLTDQIVSTEERQALCDQIVNSTEPLPARLQGIDPDGGHRKVRSVTAVVGGVILLCLIAGWMVLGTSSPTKEHVSPANKDAVQPLSVKLVADRTALAVVDAGDREMRLRVDLSLLQGVADPAIIEFKQAGDGNQTRIDELDQRGNVQRSIHIAKAENVVAQRSVDYTSRTWTEQLQVVPSIGMPSDERGVVLAIGGDESAGLAFSWIGSPAAIRQLVGNDEMVVDRVDDQGLIKVSGDVSGLDGLGAIASGLQTLTPDAHVEFWIDAQSYLPTRTRVTTTDGAVSDTQVSWAAPDELSTSFNLEIPDGFERR